MTYSEEAKTDHTLFTSKENGDWHLFEASFPGQSGLSFLGHICGQFEDFRRGRDSFPVRSAELVNDKFQLLSLNDSAAGFCWWCKERVPDDIRGVWMLHNFDLINKIEPETINCLQQAAIGPRKWKAKPARRSNE